MSLLRAALWRKLDLWDLLRLFGTASGHSDIWLLRKMPISQDLLSHPVGQHRTDPRQFSCLDQEILKPISLTNARNPASIQEHNSDSYALWDASGTFSTKRFCTPFCWTRATSTSRPLNALQAS
jgi:hypothetical protein